MKKWLRRSLVAGAVVVVAASVGLAMRPAAASVGGTGQIRNFGHGICLDVDINKADREFIPVKSYYCHGRANQTWVIEDIPGTGHQQIRNFIDPNRALCLEPYGFMAPDKGPVWVATCNGSDLQQWDFEQSDIQPEGLVSVRSVYGTELLCQTQGVCGSHTGYYLAVDGTAMKGSSTSRQGKVFMRQLTSARRDTSQQWYVPIL